MKHGNFVRRRSWKGRVIEHAFLLAFMSLASSLLVYRGGDVDHVFRQSLVWIAAGEALILFLSKRRQRRRCVPLGDCGTSF